MRRQLDHVDAGAGSMLLTGGEAGIGKTALVQRSAREVDPAARVLYGACYPLSTPCPPGPPHDIAEYTGCEHASAPESFERLGGRPNGTACRSTASPAS